MYRLQWNNQDPEPALTTATNPSASTGSGAQGATNPNTQSSSTPPPPPPPPGQVNISHCARTMTIYLNNELVNSIQDIPSSGNGLEDNFFCQFFHQNLLNIEGDPDYHQLLVSSMYYHTLALLKSILLPSHS
ncbi:hypothetical protein PM082_022846 [Marasmius tenuissimus]|nr:hypothetical protein PM082_022846 [Marasmius tenuissimus]